jgi:sec-independent protein translocase protein TatC
MSAQEQSGAMSFMEHLEELRRRLIVCVIAVGVCFIVCYMFSGPILNFLLKPLKDNIFKGGEIVYINLTEPFLIYMKAAFFGSLFLSSPIVFHQIWAFISPGLHKHERRWALPFLIGGPVLFVSGAAFAYIFLLPMTARFLVQMGEGFKAAITLRSAFSFEFYFLLGMGAVFQLPIVIFILARIGIVTPKGLIKNFRWAILIIFIAAGVLTPTPDMVTQVAFAAPMVVLYFLGVALAFFAKPSKSRAKEQAGEPAGAKKYRIDRDPEDERPAGPGGAPPGATVATGPGGAKDPGGDPGPGEAR